MPAPRLAQREEGRPPMAREPPGELVTISVVLGGAGSVLRPTAVGIIVSKISHPVFLKKVEKPQNNIPGDKAVYDFRFRGRRNAGRCHLVATSRG